MVFVHKIKYHYIGNKAACLIFLNQILLLNIVLGIILYYLGGEEANGLEYSTENN